MPSGLFSYLQINPLFKKNFWTCRFLLRISALFSLLSDYFSISCSTFPINKLFPRILLPGILRLHSPGICAPKQSSFRKLLHYQIWLCRFRTEPLIALPLPRCLFACPTNASANSSTIGLTPEFQIVTLFTGSKY